MNTPSRCPNQHLSIISVLFFLHSRAPVYKVLEWVLTLNNRLNCYFTVTYDATDGSVTDGSSVFWQERKVYTMSWSRCWRWRQQRTCILAVVGGVGGNQYPPHILESIQTSLLISLLIGLFNPEAPGSYTTAIALRHQIGISRFSFHFNIFRVLTSLPIPHRAITFVLTKTKTLSGKWHNTQRDCLFREVERTKLKLVGWFKAHDHEWWNR